MTRTWRYGDPEPADVSAVVDGDDVTWVRGCECGSDDPDNPDYVSPYWHQHLIEHLAGGAITGGSIGNDWDDIFAKVSVGSTLREATADEAETWTERWTNPTGATA